MAINTMYRPSFCFLERGEVIHVAIQDGKTTACGNDVKEYKKIYNLLTQLPLMKDAMVCNECWDAYHQRDERKFPPVK